MADFTEFKLAQPVSRITTFITALLSTRAGCRLPRGWHLAQGATKGFEQALYTVVIVFTFGFQVERHAHGVRERTEEVLDHLGAEIAHALVGKLPALYSVRATRDIQRAAGKAFVHR